MASFSGKSGSSQDGTRDSARHSGSGEKGVGGPKLSIQRSITGDTLEVSEDSFPLGDTSGDNPFNVEVTEYHLDPKLVNIHQYFPALENNFTRAVSGRLGEERQTLKAIAEEDSHSTVTADGSVWSTQVDTDSRPDMPEGSKGPSSVAADQQGGSSGVNGSAGKGEESQGAAGGSRGEEIGGLLGSGFSMSGTSSTPTCHGAGDGHLPLAPDSQPQTEGLFSTAVDEDTIEAAKQRNQNIFTTDEWSEVKVKTVSLSDIVFTKAFEHYQKAVSLQAEGRWLEVITALTKAINLKSDEAVFYRLRGEAFIQLCDFQSAILNYKKVCLLASNDVAAYQRLTFLFYFHGQCLFDQRLYPEALESFSRAAEMNPNNVGYHIRSISCLAALQRHGECLALVNKRLEMDRDNPDLYIMRARLHEMFRHTTLCYYDVKDALALQHDHPEAQQMMKSLEERAKESKSLALQLNISGKYREALQKISIAIETDPSVADYHVLRGALHRKLNDFNAAIDDFLLALDKCDHDEESSVYSSAQRQLLLTYNDFAVECFTKGYYDEAIILLNKAIKGEKNEKGLYINRGDCFFKQGELNFALLDYHQALELDGSDAAVRARISVIHNEFGVNSYQEKSYVEAEAKFTLALQYNPHVGQYYISRSRARYMLENMVGARQDLLLGLLLDPTNEDILSILARLFPGKSVADVINSPAAESARSLLYSMGPAAALSEPLQHTVHRPVELADERHPSGSSASLANNLSWQQTGSIPPLALCMEEREFNITLVHEKRKVEVDVKEALINRRSLQYKGARIAPLPPAAPHQRFGSQLKNRVPKVVSPNVVRKKGGYNWRTFGLGIGLQDS